MAKVRPDEAFGIVPIWSEATLCQYLLVQQHQGHWGFPKGHAEPGETAMQTACREFVEETGIQDYTLLYKSSFSETYIFHHKKQTIHKTVLYYPALVHNPSVKYQTDEILDYTWVEFGAAISLLTYDSTKRILTDVHHYLTAYLADHPSPTTYASGSSSPL